MRKKNFKKALSLALSLALVVSSMTVANYETKAATIEELTASVADANYNLALNKDTTIYPGCAEGNQVNLNNGALGAGGAHCAISSAWGYTAESYAVIDLGDYYDASSLDEILIQYKDTATNDTVVGRSYKIEYSADGVSYYDAVAETNVYPTPEEGEAEGLTLDENRMTIDDVSGVEGTVRYVRAYYPTTATYGIQITEIAVFAAEPVKVEVESCEDAAGVVVESPDFNTIKYSITAGEGQEEYVYMVYLDGSKLVGNSVSAGVDYELTGIAAGTHTLKVVAVYDGKVSEGIISEEITVLDVSSLITSVRNIANINNNASAKIVEVSDFYIDNAEDPTATSYTLEAAQVALDGLCPTGEGASVALRTAGGITPVTIVVDLGQYYRAAEMDKVLLAYSNPRTYAATTTVEFSEDGQVYTEVGNGSGYSCAVDNGGTADINAVALDAEKINNYSGAVRYVKLTLADGVSNWGYVVNEIGVTVNTDTPVTGLQPKLDDVLIYTEDANEIWLEVAPTPGFEDATYKAVLLDEEGLETGIETDLEFDEDAECYWGYFEELSKGTYKVKIVVNYDEGTKTIDKTFSNVVVENPKIDEAEAYSEDANEIYIEWYSNGYSDDQLYNIYLDGELYEEEIVSEYEEYTITGIPAGIHSVGVSVIYDGEESEVYTVEEITVNPVELLAEDVLVNVNKNKIYVAWEHELLEGEEAEYTVSLKGIDDEVIVESNEEGIFVHTFHGLAIDNYTVVIKSVINGITTFTEIENNQTIVDYTTEANMFKLFVYAEEELDESDISVISFNDETVEFTAADMTYDTENKLYTYVKYLGQGTYDVMLDEVEIGSVEIKDIVAAAVTNLKATKVDKNFELTWEVADAPEGQTYTVYVNRVVKAEGLTETAYTLEDMPAGDYSITVEAVYENPYSSEVYRESADCEVKIEEETTTEAPTTPSVDEPTQAPTDEPTTVVPATPNKVKKPARVKVKKATKKLAAKKISIKLKKVKGANKYQVQISKKKKFSKKNILAKKTVKKVKLTITKKKLANKKKLWVRARAIKVVNGKKYIGKWSKVKKVKVKK